MEEGETVTYTPPPPPLNPELGEGAGPQEEGGGRKASLVYKATQVKIRWGHPPRGNRHVSETTRAVGARHLVKNADLG